MYLRTPLNPPCQDLATKPSLVLILKRCGLSQALHATSVFWHHSRQDRYVLFLFTKPYHVHSLNCLEVLQNPVPNTGKAQKAGTGHTWTSQARSGQASELLWQIPRGHLIDEIASSSWLKGPNKISRTSQSYVLFWTPLIFIHPSQSVTGYIHLYNPSRSCLQQMSN